MTLSTPMLLHGLVSLSSGCPTEMCKFLTLNYYRPYGADYTVQKMVIGTHTSNDEQNYLQIVSVCQLLSLLR
jgi:hypothetical protein